MKYINYILLLSISVCLLITGCKKEVEINPAIYIQGKWKCIEFGNYPDMRPSADVGYTEYLPDSIIRFFDYELNMYTAQGKYWFEGPFYCEGSYREDGFLYYVKFNYSFYDDKLRLDFANALALFRTSILQRID